MTAPSIHTQLEMFGLDALRIQAGANRRQVAQLEAASRALGEDFAEAERLAWTHAAFCYVGLPHRRLASDADVWHRHNGKCHLLVEPGRVIERGVPRLVGVPYGALARLILIYVQTHAGDDGVVYLGKSLSAWLKRLGLAVTGGERGTIIAVREQMLRLARARMSLHWTDDEGSTKAIVERSPVDGMMLWTECDPYLREWTGALHLTPAFLAAIRERPVPLADHALGFLRGSALGLDLYTWLAHRLWREKASRCGRLLTWRLLGEQLGASFARADQLGCRIRAVLPDVLAVYPGARVDIGQQGLIIHRSPPPVPRKAARRPTIRPIHAESVTAASNIHAESVTSPPDIYAESVTQPPVSHAESVTGHRRTRCHLAPAPKAQRRCAAGVHAESVTPSDAPIEVPLL